MSIELPIMFEGTPEKLLPVLTEVNRYKIILLTGGRGGGKTELLARAVLYWGDLKKLKVVCGRETQATIEDSVHGTLSRIISAYNLNYKVQKSYLENNETGSKFIFKGFKEQGRANIKGLDDVDVLWCFPKGVEIDGKDISELEVGDYVSSFNHETNKFEKKKVLRTYKHIHKEEYILLTFNGNKHIISTNNHPYFIKDRGYLRADEIKEGDIVYASEDRYARKSTMFRWLWRDDANRYKGQESKLLEKWWLLLSRLFKNKEKRINEESESYVKQGKQREDKSHKTIWGQWLWLHKATRNALERVRSRLVGRISYSNRETKEEWKLSDLLQGRFSKYLLWFSDRNRWWKSSDLKEARRGQKENRVLRELRVESVKVLQQRDIRKYGYGEKRGYVYNIEVEGNNNYFANGLLVHNCDEGEQITAATLDIIMPTVRKDNAIVIFSMNRKTRHDAVYKRFADDPDCLHIHINYDENPSCPQILIDEANKCKERDEREYNHIWMGEPLDQTDDYLFNVKKLDEMLTNKPHGDVLKLQRVIGFDYAAQGNDLCAATIMERRSPVHWEIVDQITWSEPDPDVSKGKIISIIAEWKPDVSVMDIGGMGYVVFASLSKTGLPIYSFDGASKAYDSYTYANSRAEAYYELKNWVDKNYLILNPKFQNMIPQMETIRFKYHSSGRRLIMSKQEMKKDGFHSPDETDSLAYAVYGAIHYLGKTDQTDVIQKSTIKRVSGRRK